MKRIITSTLAAVSLLAASLAGAATPAAAFVPVRATLTAAQADALAAQTPPATINGKAAVVSKVAKPVTSPKGVMALKGMPGKVGVKKSLTGCAPTCYYYGTGKQTITNTGVSADFGIFNPTLGSHGYHSLGEIAVQSADEKQIIEVGWTVDNSGTVCPSSLTQACFFVSSWRNDIFMGYNGGNGWTNYSGRPLTPGDSLNSVVNTQKIFAIQYVAPVAPATTGRWWIAYGSGWVGSFPESSWTTGTSPVASFSTSGVYQVFHETVQNVDGPCAMMGNGTVGTVATGGPAPAAGPARIWSTSLYNQPSTNVHLNVGATSAAQPTGNLTASYRSFTSGGPQSTTGVCS